MFVSRTVVLSFPMAAIVGRERELESERVRSVYIN